MKNWFSKNWLIVVTGLVIGAIAVALTALGNPKNMGFCIACFLRDITGSVGGHSAGVVQYFRPEIVGILIGSMAMALGALGCPAVSLTGWQAGIRTDPAYGNARILHVDAARIREELNRGNVVVAAGFQGIAANGDITTLGRGGSDTTAVALAAYLHADRCQIFTDVDGVYDRDPRRYEDAVRFGKISYERMMRLIENGAQVLHDRSVELAREHGIPVEVLSAFTGSPGTIVG